MAFFRSKSFLLSLRDLQYLAQLKKFLYRRKFVVNLLSLEVLQIHILDCISNESEPHSESTQFFFRHFSARSTSTFRQISIAATKRSEKCLHIDLFLSSVNAYNILDKHINKLSSPLPKVHPVQDQFF